MSDPPKRRVHPSQHLCTFPVIFTHKYQSYYMDKCEDFVNKEQHKHAEAIGGDSDEVNPDDGPDRFGGLCLLVCLLPSAAVN